MRNLVIVESPAKSKTIQNYLGKDFVVKSSMGHIRTLEDKEFSDKIDESYVPTYKVLPDKRKVVSELKKEVKQADVVWLATDEDREGEAIAWHLYDELKLDNVTNKRIVFHEITKDAINKAIENPRDIDLNLVEAQQARSVLDKIVGFELSPVLWRKVKNGLSAGRVQSVTVRLIVEREREIQKFKPVSSYRVIAIFKSEDGKEFRAVLKNNLKGKKEAKAFLENCKNATFTIDDIEKKSLKRSPSAPFTTSTLQQEASRKLGFSVSQTMRVAQSLYESGKITYMRTDSVTLSDLALNTAKSEIVSMAGEEYYKRRNFKTKSKGAQEAHEAIRPTYINVQNIDGTLQEKRLYSLIWKRTVASQMADAQVEKTNITISVSNEKELFVASGEIVKFDGFLKLYFEGRDDDVDNEEDENILPNVKVGQSLLFQAIQALETYTKPPYRYSEASLVKKLEELGIGRPSTYAPTISTIQNRGYVEKKNIQESRENTDIITLDHSGIQESVVESKVVVDKKKLSPTDIGFVVNDFLIDNFPQILDYKFTANIEEEFDKIAAGQKDWLKGIISFYSDFHPNVDNVIHTAGKSTGQRVLGVDPKTGRNVIARIGKFGPLVQIGDADDLEKPIFASMQEEQSIETITLESALKLFKLPLVLGKYEDKDVVVASGRYGAYIKYDSSNISLPKGKNPLSISLDEAIEIIKQPRLPINLGEYEGESVVVASGRFGAYIKYGGSNISMPRGEDPFKINLSRAIELIIDKKENKSPSPKSIKEFEDGAIKVLDGRYGAYIKYNKKNYKIPGDINAEDITLEQAKEIVSIEPTKTKKRSKRSTK